MPRDVFARLAISLIVIFLSFHLYPIGRLSLALLNEDIHKGYILSLLRLNAIIFAFVLLTHTADSFT